MKKKTWYQHQDLVKPEGSHDWGVERIHYTHEAVCSICGLHLYEECIGFIMVGAGDIEEELTWVNKDQQETYPLTCEEVKMEEALE